MQCANGYFYTAFRPQLEAKQTFRCRYVHTPFGNGTEWRTDGYSRIYLLQWYTPYSTAFYIDICRITTKPTTSHEHPAKTQISLCIHSLIRVFAFRTKKHLVLAAILRANSEDYDQTGLIWVLAGLIVDATMSIGPSFCSEWSVSVAGMECWFR